MKRRLVVLLLGVATLVSLGTAWAFWGNGGSGSAAAQTGSLNGPTNVVASAPTDSSTVSLTWGGATLSTGQPATGYVVLRVRNSDGTTFPACGTTASAPTSSLSCQDLSVTDGSYRYTVTAVFGSWTAVSAASNSVTVVNDSSLPSIVVTSVSPTPNANGYNSSSPVVVNLSASAGAGIASITYKVDSGTAVTVAASTAAVSVTGDGSHTVTFSATDKAGKVSQTGSDVVRIDTMAPLAASAPALTAASDSGSSGSDQITKVTTPTFTGTAETGVTVTLYDGANPVGSSVVTAGTYTIVSSTLASGFHSFTARVVDQAGNLGPASSGTAVTIDTTAPTAPSAPFLTAASDSGSSTTDRITNVVTPTLTGVAEAGSTVTLYDATTAVGSAATTAGSYSIVSSTLSTGARPVTARSTDVAGNLGPASAITTVTIDITAPTKPGTPVLTAASDSGRSATDQITKVTAPTVTGSTTAGDLVTLVEGTTVLGSTTAATATYSITSSTLTHAVHTLTTKSTDVAGNQGPLSTAVAVTVDTLAPAAPTALKLATTSDTGRSSTDGITNKTTPVVTASNESNAIVTVYDGANQIGLQTTTGTTASITSTTLAEGSHTLTATSTDIAGNLGPATSGFAVVVDTIAPATSASRPILTAASDTGSSSSDRITKTTTPAFTGTAGTGDTVTLYNGGVLTGTAVTATSGTYTATTGTLLDGVRTITAVATDVAGNAAATTVGTTVTIDTVVPTVTVNQAASQADPTSTAPVNFTVTFSEPVADFINTDVSLTGTASATGVTLTGSGAAYNSAATGMTKTGTVIATVTAGKATDAAGNANSAAVVTDNTVSYTYIDTTAPVVVISSFTPGAGRTAVVSGSAGFGPGDSASLTVVLCADNSFPCAGTKTKATLTGVAVNATTGAWSVTSAALTGSPTVYARATQTDLTGNTGNSAVAGPITVS